MCPFTHHLLKFLIRGTALKSTNYNLAETLQILLITDQLPKREEFDYETVMPGAAELLRYRLPSGQIT
jgi:hypothetical protein